MPEVYFRYDTLQYFVLSVCFVSLSTKKKTSGDILCKRLFEGEYTSSQQPKGQNQLFVRISQGILFVY